MIRRLRYVGLIVATLWGFAAVLITASSDRSAIFGEGPYVLLLTLLPLVVLAPVHSAFGARDRPWPAIYAIALAALFAGTLAAYHNVFGSDGPDLGISIVSTALIFLLTYGSLRLLAEVTDRVRGRKRPRSAVPVDRVLSGRVPPPAAAPRRAARSARGVRPVASR